MDDRWVKKLKSWQWDFNTGSDPTTYYCDVYENDIDWWGDSHHPLWKGPFNIGFQKFEEFLLNGPVKNTYVSNETVEEVKKFILNRMSKKTQPQDWRDSDILREVKFKTSLSGGKGGQNVNKVNTKVELYWSPSASYVLTDEQKIKVISALQNKLNKEGEIRIVSQEERSQLKNKQKAIDKFLRMLSECFKEKKKRKPTKPSKASAKKRIENKLKRKDVKQGRKKPDY